MTDAYIYLWQRFLDVRYWSMQKSGARTVQHKRQFVWRGMTAANVIGCYVWLTHLCKFLSCYATRMLVPSVTDFITLVNTLYDINWSSKLPDWTHADSFLWGSLKLNPKMRSQTLKTFLRKKTRCLDQDKFYLERTFSSFFEGFVYEFGL